MNTLSWPRGRAERKQGGEVERGRGREEFRWGGR